MRFDNSEDDERDDYFERFDEEEPKPKPVKTPRYKPDDPRYWDREEGEWEHLRPSRKWRLILISTAVVAALVLLIIGYNWLFSPAIDDVVEYGYVDHVERRGDIFKTYEGNLLPYKEIHDTTRAYKGDFVFSASQNIGKVLRGFQESGRPVKVHYKVYRSTMPWRGDTRTVIVKVDTVSPDSILPAAYLPWRH